MKIFDLFRRPKRGSAQLAKERLQIIVSHESARKTGPDIVQRMQQELLAVICKYVQIDQDKIKVQLERHGDQSILELNVTLPEGGLLNLTDPVLENTAQTTTQTNDEVKGDSKAQNPNQSNKAATTSDSQTQSSSDASKQSSQNSHSAKPKHKSKEATG